MTPRSAIATSLRVFGEPQHPLLQLREDAKERQYHRIEHKPIGQCTRQNDNLPARVRDAEFRFGVPGGNAKDNMVIPKVAAEETPETREMYLKSHHHIEVGAQWDRKYDPAHFSKEGVFGEPLQERASFYHSEKGPDGKPRHVEWDMAQCFCWEKELALAKAGLEDGAAERDAHGNAVVARRHPKLGTPFPPMVAVPSGHVSGTKVASDQICMADILGSSKADALIGLGPHTAVVDKVTNLPYADPKDDAASQGPAHGLTTAQAHSAEARGADPSVNASALLMPTPAKLHGAAFTAAFERHYARLALQGKSAVPSA